MKNEAFEYKPQDYRNEKQQTMSFCSINSDIEVWEGAGWEGCGFAFTRQEIEAPIFGLAFKDIKRGNKIVSEWRDKLEKDKKSIIMYIVRGIDKQHPTWYRVCVAPGLRTDEMQDGCLVASICRKHTMTPDNSWNLDTFERLFLKFGFCFLSVFQYDKDGNAMRPQDKGGRFANVEFRNAWEIGLNDFAQMALDATDEPFIPDSKKEIAPIIETMSMIRERSKYSN